MTRLGDEQPTLPASYVPGYPVGCKGLDEPWYIQSCSVKVYPNIGPLPDSSFQDNPRFGSNSGYSGCCHSCLVLCGYTSYIESGKEVMQGPLGLPKHRQPIANIRCRKGVGSDNMVKWWSVFSSTHHHTSFPSLGLQKLLCRVSSILADELPHCIITSNNLLSYWQQQAYT